MSRSPELFIEPSKEVLDAARRWLERMRPELGAEFLAAYLTGSALTQGFDPRRSDVNLLIVTRSLDSELLQRLADAHPRPGRGLRVTPLVLTRSQIEKSVDTFPIEFLDIKESHLLLEGENVFAQIEVPRTYLRLQCEHELRGKFIRLRQTFLLERDSQALADTLARSASSFGTLFRTLLRLRGEVIPAHTAKVIEKVADVYGLQPEGLLEAYTMRYSERRRLGQEVRRRYLRFLAAIEGLVAALDKLQIS
jgi:predicted nucleotidyltransferase